MQRWLFLIIITGAICLAQAVISPQAADSDPTREPNDLAAVSLTGSTTPRIGAQTLYTLTIANPGTNLQSNYQVQLFTGAGIQVFNWPGPDIQPGQTLPFNLPWIPETVGPETLYARVALAGDQNPANDQTPNLEVVVQAVHGIGPGDQLANVPLNMYYRTSLFETIYYGHEMNCAGQITAICFHNNFSTPLLDIPTQIWLGETTLNDLTGGWIPSSQLTQVFSGDVDYPYGENEIVITLSTPYQYNGGNLVMLAYRPWDNDYYSSMDRFYCQTVGNNRSLAVYNDNTTINPDNPPTTGVSGQFPHTVFIFNNNGLGGLKGTVFSGASPLNGATVSISGTQLQSVTFDGGGYRFSFLPQGTYQVSAAKTGYTTVTQTVIVTEHMLTLQDFTLSPITQVTVSGRVLGSNAPNGLANATVVLAGYANYTAGTDANGYFSIPGVYSGQTYTYNISAPGYQPQEGTIIVGAANQDMGTVFLTEIAYPPSNVLAVETPGGNMVDLSWHAPNVAQEGWIHYDNGENFNAFGTAGSLSFDVAIRFPPDSLAAYAGTFLQAVKIWPAMGGNFKVRVWTGGSSTEPGTMVVDQPIIPVLNAWNTIQLDFPVWVSATEELWFGFLCDVTGVNPAYAGVDAGPAVNGFGNMIHWQGNWTTLLAVNAYCDFNWNIQGYVGLIPPPAISDLESHPTVLEIKGKTSAPTISAGRDDYRITAYKVWRFLQGQANNEAAWTSLTPNPITETTFQDTSWYALPDGTYYWAVKAIYINGYQSEPAFSNALEKVTQVGTIAGTVRNQQNAPLQGATVTCGTVTATTNSGGAYSLLVNAGTWDVTASCPGYANSTLYDVIVITGQTTTANFMLYGVSSDDPSAPPSNTALLGAFPNPFHPRTSIRYSIRESVPVSLEVYNLKGQLVRVLVEEVTETGYHAAVWDGRDDEGRPASSGIYLCRMQAGAYSRNIRLVLMK